MTLLEMSVLAAGEVTEIAEEVTTLAEETTAKVVEYAGVYKDFFESLPLDREHWYNTFIIAVIGIVVVFVVLGIIALFVKALGAVFDTINSKKTASAGQAKTKAPAAPENAAPAVKAEAVKAEVKLIDVTEEQAAMIMAIVSDKTGIPLNHLKFNYIKPVEEKE